MGWKKGQSGNPAGRSKGAGQVAKLRATILGHVPEIIENLVVAALAGDTSAAKLLIERAIPVLKSVEEPVRLPMPADAALADHGRAILAAAGAGALSPGQVASLLNALGALAKVIETDELEKRIAALEENRNDDES